MLEQLKSLADRLEGLSGPDRETDVALEIWAHPFLKDLPRDAAGWSHPEYGRIRPAQAYTSSLDAAVALVEREMAPKLLDIEGSWEPRDKAVWPAWSVRWYPAGVDRDGKSWHAQVGTGPTPAIALLRALLAAKIAEAEMSTTLGVD